MTEKHYSNEENAGSMQPSPPTQSDVFAASAPFADQHFLGIDGFNVAGPLPLASPVSPQLEVEATCLDVHRSLSVYLDGELAIHQSNAVQRHLAVCGACQSAQAFQMQLRTTVASKAFDPMPSDVRTRITQALGFDQQFGDVEQ